MTNESPEPSSARSASFRESGSPRASPPDAKSSRHKTSGRTTLLRSHRHAPRYRDENGERLFQGKFDETTHAPLEPNPECKAKDAYEEPLHQAKGTTEPHYYDYLSREWLNYPENKNKLRPRGRNRKPESAKKSQPFTGESEHASQFRPKSSGRDTYRPKRGSTIPLGGGGFSGTTEFRDRFPGHEPVPPAPAPRPAYHPNDVPLQDTTTYKDNFVPQKSGKPSQFSPRPHLKLPGGNMTETPEHRRAFVDPQGKGRPNKYSPLKTRRPNVDFAGTSSYARDYPRHDVRKHAPSPKRNQKFRSKPQPGTLPQSTYRDSIGQPDTDNINEPPPANPSPRRSESAPMPSQTEASDTFRNPNGSPLTVNFSPMKPRQNLHGGGDFRPNTENRDKYVPHETVPPLPTSRPEYRPNNIPLQSQTTYRQTYSNYDPQSRPSSVRHRENLRTGGPFKPDTENRSNFRPWDVQPRRPATSTSPRIASPHFAGTTEYSRKYTRHNLGSGQRKPPSKVIDRQFVDPSTTYRDGPGAFIDEDIASEDSRGYVY
eukprot:gb/GECG01013235.1/.p1 GENE.gb/GECG01013235.1/~~gb/GECG01013235.1/.p1  ORF type:complete len:542 (+),score=44.42 gb/GECG01013235.1/:1-1626(+)